MPTPRPSAAAAVIPRPASVTSLGTITTNLDTIPVSATNEVEATSTQGSTQKRNRIIVVGNTMRSRKIDRASLGRASSSLTLRNTAAVEGSTPLRDFLLGLKEGRSPAMTIHTAMVDSLGEDPTTPVDETGLWFNTTDHSNCLVADMRPGPSSARLTGPSACQTLDVEDGDPTVNSAADLLDRAMNHASPPIPPPANLMGLLRLADRLKDQEWKDGSAPQNLPATIMIQQELVVHCAFRNVRRDSTAIRANCTDAMLLRAVLRGNFTPELTGYQMSVNQDITAPRSVLAYLKTGVPDFDFVASREPQQYYDGRCPGYSRFRVGLVTTDDAVATALVTALNAIARDPTPIVDGLKLGTSPTAAIQPCGLVMEGRPKRTAYPAVNQPAWRPSGSDVVGPTITVGIKSSVTPVNDVVMGQTYDLFVYNFPDKATIVIELFKGVEDQGTVLMQVKDFVDEGYMTVKWNVPLPANGVLPLGRHYLRAYDVREPEIFATSQAFRFRTR